MAGKPWFTEIGVPPIETAAVRPPPFMEPSMPDTPLKPTANDPFAEGREAARARRMRSLAIAGALLVFVGLVFAVSILRLSGHGLAN